MLRRDNVPLHTSEEIYSVIAGMHVGDVIPAQVYIHDYADGSIPEWTIAEIEQHDFLLIVTFIDPSSTAQSITQECMVSIGLDVFFAPEKTLSAPTYLYYPGCEHARNMLCDIRQEARKISEREGVRPPVARSPVRRVPQSGSGGDARQPSLFEV